MLRTEQEAISNATKNKMRKITTLVRTNRFLNSLPFLIIAMTNPSSLNISDLGAKLFPLYDTAIWSDL
jgi:hypothetical protein